MKKKIDLFWYWFILVVAFVLCFFAINNKKVDAYYLDSNGNIHSDNRFNLYDISPRTNGTGSLTYYSKDGILYINGTTTNGTYFNLSDFSNIKNMDYNLGKYVTLQTIMNGECTAEGRCIEINLQVVDNGYFLQNSYSSGIKNNVDLHPSRLLDKDIVGLGVWLPAGSYIDFNFSIMLLFSDTQGYYLNEFVPFGTWYSDSFVGDLATGVISFSSASLTYDNSDYGTSHSISDVSSYIDSSFGYLYFERLWQYLDTLTSSAYDNAWLTLQLNNKMNLNTIYVLNAMFNNGNYGVGVKFYQGDNLILNATNWSNNNYSYCNETSGATCSVLLSNFVNVGDKPDLQNSFTYFDKIEIWSSDTDKRTGSFGFQNISYNQGYNSGYNIGYSSGVSTGENAGYNKGYNSGYLYGYEKGVDAVEGTDNTLVGLVGGIMTAPVNMLKTIFDFEFLGINLTHFIFSIVSLFIVIWLIKIFL